MTSPIERSAARVLAKRAKAKLIQPQPDIITARAMSDRAVGVVGQVYDSKTAGYKPAEPVEVVNEGNAGNARYVARFGDRGGIGGALNAQLRAQIQKMIDKSLQALLDSKELTDRVIDNTPAIPITPTVYNIFRAISGPTSGTGASVSIDIPASVQPGDHLLGFIAMDRVDSVIKTVATIPGTGLWPVSGYILDTGFYAEGSDAGGVFIPGSFTDVNEGFAFQYFSKTADADDAGSTLEFDIINHDPGGYTGSCASWVAVLIVLDQSVSSETVSIGSDTAYSTGWGKYINSPYTTPAEQDLYYLSDESGTINDSSTGNPAEAGGITPTKTNQVLFFVCASLGDIDITPTVSERAICNHSDGALSLYVGCKLSTSTDYTGSHVFTQSAGAYSVSCTLSIESF